MRKRDRLELERYVRHVANEMELRDWTLQLLTAPCDPDYNAHVHIVYGRKLAQIAVDSDFRSFSPEKQRATIVHELVHCLLEPATNMALNDVQPHLGLVASRIWEDSFRRSIEYSTDAIADALAKHLPLITWPK